MGRLVIGITVSHCQQRQNSRDIGADRFVLNSAGCTCNIAQIYMHALLGSLLCFCFFCTIVYCNLHTSMKHSKCMTANSTWLGRSCGAALHPNSRRGGDGRCKSHAVMATGTASLTVGHCSQRSHILCSSECQDHSEGRQPRLSALTRVVRAV